MCVGGGGGGGHSVCVCGGGGGGTVTFGRHFEYLIKSKTMHKEYISIYVQNIIDKSIERRKTLKHNQCSINLI